VTLFWIKKLVASLVLPLGLGGILLVAGSVLLLIRRRLVGTALVIVAAVVLIGFSLTPVALRLAAPLEGRYPALDAASLPVDLEAVVVLGGGVLDGPADLGPAARLTPTSLKRTLEGVRLWRTRPAARLILSSGAWRRGRPLSGQVMAELALEMGVAKERVVAETLSRDTYENARQTAALLDSGPFVLVTSASHMPRSMAVFHRLGLEPIPAPTDYLIADPAPAFWFLPSIKALAINHTLLHEYLGLVWYKLNSLI